MFTKAHLIIQKKFSRLHKLSKQSLELTFDNFDISAVRAVLAHLFLTKYIIYRVVETYGSKNYLNYIWVFLELKI